MEDPDNKPDAKQETAAKQEPDAKQEPAARQEPAATPDPFEGINARLAAMEQAQADMMKAISAIANQGAVNASVRADNGNAPGDDEYPDIDLDSLNRLIGD